MRMKASWPTGPTRKFVRSQRRGQVRQHAAVEKRYRRGLNDKYTNLSRAVLKFETQRICRTERPDWDVQYPADSNSR